MYSLREKWEISLSIWHTVPRFNPSLFTISFKSKVLFQCHSEITWSTVDSSLAWFLFIWLGKVNKLGLLLHKGPLPDFLISLLYLWQSVCCSKFLSRQQIFSIMWFKFHCLLKFFTWWNLEKINLINLCQMTFCLHGFYELGPVYPFTQNFSYKCFIRNSAWY